MDVQGWASKVYGCIRSLWNVRSRVASLEQQVSSLKQTSPLPLEKEAACEVWWALFKQGDPFQPCCPACVGDHRWILLGRYPTADHGLVGLLCPKCSFSVEIPETEYRKRCDTPQPTV